MLRNRGQRREETEAERPGSGQPARLFALTRGVRWLLTFALCASRQGRSSPALAIGRWIALNGVMTARKVNLHGSLAVGDGVVLRRWRDQDAPAVATACSDREIARWIPVPQPYTTDEARRYIELTRAWWQSGEVFVLCVDRGGEAVGSISLRRDRTEPTIGYWLAPLARGSGLMTRAVEAIAAWAGAELGLREVSIYVDPANDASRAVAKRAGFIKQEGTVDFPDGTPRLLYRRAIRGQRG